MFIFCFTSGTRTNKIDSYHSKKCVVETEINIMGTRTGFYVKRINVSRISRRACRFETQKRNICVRQEG
jgi:hypothetical protein